MRKIVKENQRFSRRVVSDDDARDELADEPYKLELIGLKGSARRRCRGRERRGRRRRAHHLRQPQPQRRGGLEGPVPRSAPAHHEADPGVQADALAPRRTGAATRRTSSSSASTAPPGSPRRRSRSTCTGSRRPRAATTASWVASSTCSASPTRSAPGWSVFHPKGGVIKRVMEDYVRQRHIEEGFSYVGTPHISKEGLFHTSGHLPYYADTHVPADGVRGRGLLPQGHELPDAQPDLQVARALLPRAAAAALRVRVGLPLREVRRGPRPHPRARDDAGRLPLLLHPGAGARPRSSTCSTSC